ncbi:M48 family metallopeptidase [Planococcus sp. 1R117A]|uniref:M48 family metallopeptidase n=1 Tax=Planococcus sp. 1R117A TaxID=3447020 RepID=UPI003EDB85C4
MNNASIQSNRETVYFIISLAFSIFVYLLAIVSIVGIAIALPIFVMLLFTNALMLGSVRGNGVRIHEKQFPDVYESVQALSKEMGLKKVPDVFVVQSEGALNAFATRFFGRNMVVLYSEVFELAREQGQEELNFVIAHELAHVKRRHVWKNILIMPAGFIPFLSQAYSRSCEYTCDRHAAYTIQNAAAAKRALTLLGIGKKMYTEVNEEAYREQIASESNSFVWLSEVLSSHPNLPKRIQAIQQFENSSTPVYTPNHGKIALSASLLFAAAIGVYFLTIAIFAGGTMVYSQFMPESFTESLYSDDFTVEGQTPLMTAVSDGDLAEVEQLVADGADVNEKDSEGADALMHAIYSGDTAIISYLLEAGADVNTADDYSTGLGAAVLYGEYESAKLLMEKGADPTLAGSDGMSAMDFMGTTSETEFITLVQSGAY